MTTTPVRTVTPPTTSGGAWTMVERNLLIYRRGWPVILAEVFEPLLYLAAFGVGIGALVGDVPGLPDSTSYPRFVAPALLATAAMNGAMNETTFTVYGRLRVGRVYESILTTPMTVRSVALGEITWALLRGTFVAIAFLLVVTVFGLAPGPWALLVIPGALLVGFAFASIGLLVVTLLRDWQDLELVQLVMLPMFLFSTTFIPLDVYPAPIGVVVQCLPLHHGIELVRGLFLDTGGPQLLLAVAYLALLGAAALVVAVRRLEHTLRT